ncbi:MAG: ankyrin repeat protein [Faunusvirus sp.]|jgi:hypothetical protein|uniref:Ankyrin repeat protein n=1 Tax=Faunusvirus sp. TaxID=2487766 RepID=A0A3G4ZY55_9VIRU|nr:MAG: ankyrin repeat protein [Faunusvirus sp.]
MSINLSAGCSGQNNIDSKILNLYRENKSGVIAFLIENNLLNNLAFADENGNTILHYVVMNKDRGLLEHILKYVEEHPETKKVLNTQNSNGDTPLHIAVRDGDPLIPLLLDKAGTDKSIRNNKNQFVGIDGKVATTGILGDKPFDKIMNLLMPKQATPVTASTATESPLGFDVLNTEEERTVGKPQKIEQFLTDLTKSIAAPVKPLSLEGGDEERARKMSEKEQEISNILEEVLKKIMEDLNIDDIQEGRAWRATLNRYVRENFPDLSKLDKAKKALELADKQTLKKLDQSIINEIREYLKKKEADKKMLKKEEVIAVSEIKKIEEPSTASSEKKPKKKASAKATTPKAKKAKK